MKFEDLPSGDKYKHRIDFAKGEEAEVVGATYRERVANLALAGQTAKILDHELEFSGWDSESEKSMFVNNPELIAAVLENFHKQTGDAIIRIAWGIEASFDSDAIARRVALGKKANQLAGLIRGQSGVPELVRELDELDSALFTNGSDSQET